VTVWLQITAGQGPAACAWVVDRLTAALAKEASAKGITWSVLESEPHPSGRGSRSVLVGVQGASAEAFAASVVGTHQWKGRSPFRPQHKRQNWFVGVSVLPVPERLVALEREVRFQCVSAGGPGGQHVNKRATAVRAVHVPTGLAVRAEAERSQLRNRKLALAKLAAALAAHHDEKVAQGRAARWQEHRTLSRGNPVRVYAGLAFRRSR